MAIGWWVERTGVDSDAHGMIDLLDSFEAAVFFVSAGGDGDGSPLAA